MSLSVRIRNAINTIKSGSSGGKGGTQGPPESPPSGPSTGGGGGDPKPPSAPFDPDQVDFSRAPAGTPLKVEQPLNLAGDLKLSDGPAPVAGDSAGGATTVPVRGVQDAAVADNLKVAGDPDPVVPGRTGPRVVHEEPGSTPPPEPGGDDGGSPFGQVSVDNTTASDGFDPAPGGRTGPLVVHVDDEDGGGAEDSGGSPLTPRTVPGDALNQPIAPVEVEADGGDGIEAVARKAGEGQKDFLTVKMSEANISTREVPVDGDSAQDPLEAPPPAALAKEAYAGGLPGGPINSTLVDLEAETDAGLLGAESDSLDLDDIDVDVESDALDDFDP